MKVIVAHPGKQHSFHLVRQLYKHGLLHEFHTGIAYGKDSWMFKLISKLPNRYFVKLSGRILEDVPDRYIKRYFFIELIALLRMRMGQEEEHVFYHRNKRFQEKIKDKQLQAVDVVIGFDTSSWILAQRCLLFGKKFVLDVSIAHPVSKDNVYRDIVQRYPDWKFSVKQKVHEHIAVEQAEMRLAHHIVVASSFTLKTYVEQGVRESKISINPYGVDFHALKPIENKPPQEKIRLVFLGLVDARKGIPMLLEVWKKIKSLPLALTLIGPVSREMEEYISTHFPEVELKGKLPFHVVKTILPAYDVMVFPSFFEGFGLVVPEAMACGLPVLTTTATCGPDIITEGKEGMIIASGDANGLQSAIEQLVQNRNLIPEMGKQARQTVLQYSWDAYGEKWHHLLHEYCQ